MRTDADRQDSEAQAQAAAQGTVSFLLFDSLVHHLIEKGALTKNDALSVVQTAAEVVRGQVDDGRTPPLQASAALALLQHIYSSFEAVQDKTGAAQRDGHNVHSLRPPLHGDGPRFPPED